MKLNIDKLKENTISQEELSEKHFLDVEFQKEYLNLSLRESVSSFAKKVNIDRANLYTLFNGEKIPRLDTIAKILKELGFSIQVA